jgi:hypothetical protein
MLLIREVMHCKPGKVRPMVEKALAMSKAMEKSGMGKMRVLTDLAAERYWTVIMEFEAPDMKSFDAMIKGEGQNEAAMKEMDGIMQGYHELVDLGRREIYTIEAAK